MLCDCPGLVFPSFVSTKDELIVNGILSIDEMRDYIGPVNLISFSHVCLFAFF
jgi:large subunit GTPase 1